MAKRKNTNDGGTPGDPVLVRIEDAKRMRWRILPSEESDPTKVESALRERVKELNCLYGITQMAESGPESIGEFLARVVQLLPPAWQYPEITCARIVFEGTAYKTRGFKASRWHQSAEIFVFGEAKGQVEVHYRKERPPLYEGPFLREERTLLDAVAERIGAVAMRLAAEKELQESNRQLTVERQALQEANTALRAVLARIEEEKRTIHRDIQANVEKVLMPIIFALLAEMPRPYRRYVELLRDNLLEIAAPYANALSQRCHSLTPTELAICTMIRNGLQSKEIADMRNVSPATISRHRERIRRKLGIANSNVNLTTYLQSIM
jgi:DNA-binding CsgD family transcriptional regulator/FtsZ-binding cell division protein ZapB